MSKFVIDEQGYAEKLLAWVKSAQIDDDWRLSEVKRTSRNTCIYLFTSGDKALLARVNHNAKKSDIENEVKSLKEIYSLIQGYHSQIKVVEPFGICKEPLALVTIKEEGMLLSEYITAYLQRNRRNIDAFHHGIELAGKLLGRIHNKWRISSGESSNNQVRLFLDFSPKNLLVRDSENPEIILFDTPEKFDYGSPWKDVGTFTFELTRAAVRGIGVKAITDSRVIDMKKKFIFSYCEERGIDYKEDIWQLVLKGERSRANEVIGFYTKFWRSDKWLKEMLRGTIYGIMVLIYGILGIPILSFTIKNTFESK